MSDAVSDVDKKETGVTTSDVDKPLDNRPLCDHDGFSDRLKVTVLSKAKDGKRICVSLTAKAPGSKSLTVHLVKDKTGVYWIDKDGNALARVGSI